MTILEVLFSILVTSVGLLGAIALFPVASAQARRARTNDAAAASAHSAIHMFDTLGMRRPDRWVGHPATWNLPAGGTNYGLVRAMPNVPPGTSFCIDPRTIASPVNAFGSRPQQASLFPYVPRQSTLPVPDPRMFRITLVSGSTLPANLGMSKLQADLIFQFGDDLAFYRPGLDDVSTLGLQNDRSLPAFQDFALPTSRYPTHRPTEGRMSWMATLVPKVEIYSGQVSDEYILSIVIFADRPSDLLVDDPSYERVVNAVVQGDGSTGGELLLSWPIASRNDALAKEQLKVRANDWILLAANQHLTPTNFVPRFQWYRVTDVDDIEWSTDVANAHSRYITVMGQDWNTDYRLPSAPTTPNLAEATLIDGVIAVYEKTIRLDYGSSF